MKVSFKISLVVLAIVSAMSPMAVRAQEPAARPVGVNSRVRIFAPSLRKDRYIGRIDSLDVNQVVLDTAGVRRRLGFDTGPVLVQSFRLVTLRSSAIERIEVSAGRTVRSATIKGMVIGAIGGALLLGFGNLPEVNPKAKDFFKGAPLGLVLGAVGGGVVGYALGGEKWAPAQLPR